MSEQQMHRGIFLSIPLLQPDSLCILVLVMGKSGVSWSL
jgi:hypothetical protein